LSFIGHTKRSATLRALYTPVTGDALSPETKWII
jgi:hypothetical protein